jgi:hypothetical protein
LLQLVLVLLVNSSEGLWRRLDLMLFSVHWQSLDGAVAPGGGIWALL